MNWIPVSHLLLLVLVLFVTSLKADDAFNQRSTPPPSPVIKSPLIDQLVWDNVKLIERTQLLEQTLHRTLEALSNKLGQPFDDIINSLHVVPTGSESRRTGRSTDKIVIPEVVNSYSLPSNNTNSQESMLSILIKFYTGQFIVFMEIMFKIYFIFKMEMPWHLRVT